MQQSPLPSPRHSPCHFNHTQGQDLEGCRERARRLGSYIWSSSVLCELCYETEAEENTWSAEAGLGARDVRFGPDLQSSLEISNLC